MPYHLILHGKISGRGNYGFESFWAGRGGGEGGGGGGVIFGPRFFFFWLPRETDKSVLIKLHGKKTKKNEIVCSFNGIPITCRLEMEFFFTQSEIITVSCLHNAIESKTALSRGT